MTPSLDRYKRSVMLREEVHTALAAAGCGGQDKGQTDERDDHYDHETTPEVAAPVL